MSLTHDELEREIVNYDKQKLISQCLKVFDSNVRLAEEVKQARRNQNEARADAIKEIKERRRLQQRTLWQVINERLEIRINNIRSRRKNRKAKP